MAGLRNFNNKKDDDDVSVGGESQASTATNMSESSAFQPYNKQQLVQMNDSVRRKHWNKIPVPRRSAPRNYYDTSLAPRSDLSSGGIPRTIETRTNWLFQRRKRTKLRRFSETLLVTCFCIVTMVVFLEDDFLDFVLGDMYYKDRLLCMSGALRNRLNIPSSISHRHQCEGESPRAEPIQPNVVGEIARRNKQISIHPSDYLTSLPQDNQDIAFVTTVPSCPEDSEHPKANDDAGFAFYDAAAILKESVGKATNDNMSSKYNSTMYAVIHPDALSCKGPESSEDGEEPYYFDRVAMLKDLGYSVIVWKEPLSLDGINSCVKDEIQKDGNNGIRDLMRLYAYNFTNHPVAVMTSFDTVIKDSIDGLIDSFKETGSKTAMYSRKEDSNINTGMVFLKPNSTELSNMMDLYQKTPYTCDEKAAGWDGSGIKGMGVDGFLNYYYNLNNHKNDDETMDKYTNAEKSSCKVMNFASHKECGKPWECQYDERWDKKTKETCGNMHQSWYGHRREFETKADSKSEDEKTEKESESESSKKDKVAFHRDIFLGYCDAEVTYHKASNKNDPSTPKNAPMMMTPKMLSSIAKKFRKSSPIRLPSFLTGEEFVCGVSDSAEEKQTNSVTSQRQKLTLTTSRTIVMDDNIEKVQSCISGSITESGYEAPMNLLFVVDTSDKTQALFPGMTMGDLNHDGISDSVLDVQIAVIIQALETIRDSNGYLNNENVVIGLVGYNTEGELHGTYPPLDPKDSTQINPSILRELETFTIGGNSNFDDALDKAINFFEKVADPNDEKYNNIMYFFAGSLPDVIGDGDDEEKSSASLANGNGSPVNEPETINFGSELEKLDWFKVKRYGIGLGSATDIRPDFGLDKLDNTPNHEDKTAETGAQKVYTFAALQRIVFSSSTTTDLQDFALYVNGERDYSLTTRSNSLIPLGGPFGFAFHNHMITVEANLDTNINVRVEISLDENHNGDWNKIMVENVIEPVGTGIDDVSSIAG